MNALQTLACLGDAGTPNTDASYGGEVGDSVLSMQYWRDKAGEYQRVMDSLDTTARAIRTVLGAGVSEQDADELQMWLSDYEDKRAMFRGTAQAINAGAMVVNAAGGRFPVMQVPQTLAALPMLPIVAVAAFATAATLISWGRSWMEGVNRRLHDQRMLDTITDPEQRARAAEAVLQANSAQASASTSPWVAAAGIVKYGAFALLAYMGWKMWNNR